MNFINQNATTMRQKLSALLLWLSIMIMPKYQKNNQKRYASEKEELSFAHEDKPEIEKIALCFLEATDESDIQTAYGWLTKILDSQVDAEINLLLLSLVRKKHLLNDKLPNNTSWKVFIESTFEGQFKDMVHIHGEVKFIGETIITYCNTITKEEFDYGKVHSLLSTNLAQYYYKILNKDKKPLVAWHKFKTVSKLMRQ